MARLIYERTDPDGTHRACFLPWWWRFYALALRLRAQLTGVRPPDGHLARMHVRHARWRITPPGY